MSYYAHFKQSKGNRDTVFASVLARLQGAVRILEIGVARDLSFAARQSDGWSSMHFAECVALRGGHLDSVDTSESALANCTELVKSFMPFSHALHRMTGQSFLKGADSFYDLILIDGSDEPNEMLDCFELAKGKGRLVLCDDFHAKGALLKVRFPTTRCSRGIATSLRWLYTTSCRRFRSRHLRCQTSNRTYG